MKYGVRYTDNCDDSIQYYNTIEEAEKAIEEELENCKEYYQSLDYDYADFGAKTEFWGPDSDEYATWERLWV